MRYIINRNPPLSNENPDYNHNALDADIIDIIQFNYDGNGTALCLFDGIEEIVELSIADVDFILFSGHYTLERPLTRRVLLEKASYIK